MSTPHAFPSADHPHRWHLNPFAFFFGGPEHGSGPVTSEDRPPGGPIRAVVAGNALRLSIVQGEKASVQVTAPADVLPRIVTRLDGDTLYIELQSGSYTGDMVVTITTPGISSLHLGGTCTAEVSALSGDCCDIRLSGASRARLRGTAELARIQVAGSSRADLAEVVAGSWEVGCTGASTCVIAGPARRADVKASGASTIDASALQVEQAQARAAGASTIRLGRTGSLRQAASGASTITTA
jgi:hypothetical protein